MRARSDMWCVMVFLACVCTTVHAKSALPRRWLPSRINSGESASRGHVTTSAVVAKEQRRRKSSKTDQQQLYEAYSMLHSLAQDFHKPFDAPAVLVVGHQSSGKSALIEALMGFQFNQVGGGTKTRRPIALRMQYNASCDVPRCFLTLPNGAEELISLSDIQAYIEKENFKLERDPTRSYDSREINIRMEYRHCPNMILIDTPGMIHAPKGNQLSVQQRAIAQASKEAENLVLEKMKCKDYIILCVEDTTDWKHATTRNVVMQADPTLSRTVLVTTKLDTKLSQFSEGKDVENFLKAPLIGNLFPHIYGGPFFTSVPTGRVGTDKDFGTNEDFVAAIKSAEYADNKDIYLKVKAQNQDQSSLLQHVGVSKLRSYLEDRVDDCYRRNVAKILPMLQSDYRQAADELSATQQELSSLSVENLRSGANMYRETFVKELSGIIQGTAKVSPSEWGETLEEEQASGSGFLDNKAEAMQSNEWRKIASAEVGNSAHKLFGGAQYHRALREFAAAAKHINPVVITEDEIANAAGVGDMHDGVNYMRAACVLSLDKAHATFDPMLQSLQQRCTHIMDRLFPLLDGLITEELSHKASRQAITTYSNSNSFRAVVQQIYSQFIKDQMAWCLEKCQDDLHGMTRFVTWDVDGKGASSSLYSSLPTPKSMLEIYNVAVEKKTEEMNEQKQKMTSSLWGWRKKEPLDIANLSLESRVLSEWKAANGLAEIVESKVGRGQITSAPEGYPLVSARNTEVSDDEDVLHLMDEMISMRNANRTSIVVTTLVQYIIRTWREHFAKSVAQKFNCFFLLPFIDEFPNYLRTELDKLYAHEEGTGVEGGLFDISEAREKLLDMRDRLVLECDANAELQTRFDQIKARLGSDMGISHTNKHTAVRTA